MTYSEDLVSKANASHGSWGSLGLKHNKNSLALGEEADTTFALLVLTDGHLTHTCKKVNSNSEASHKPQNYI